MLSVPVDTSHVMVVLEVSETECSESNNLSTKRNRDKRLIMPVDTCTSHMMVVLDVRSGMSLTINEVVDLEVLAYGISL